jgi:hypothetical protein
MVSTQMKDWISPLILEFLVSLEEDCVMEWHVDLAGKADQIEEKAQLL